MTREDLLNMNCPDDEPTPALYDEYSELMRKMQTKEHKEAVDSLFASSMEDLQASFKPQ